MGNEENVTTDIIQKLMRDIRATIDATFEAQEERLDRLENHVADLRKKVQRDAQHDDIKQTAKDLRRLVLRLIEWRKAAREAVGDTELTPEDLRDYVAGLEEESSKMIAFDAEYYTLAGALDCDPCQEPPQNALKRAEELQKTERLFDDALSKLPEPFEALELPEAIERLAQERGILSQRIQRLESDLATQHAIKNAIDTVSRLLPYRPDSSLRLERHSQLWLEDLISRLKKTIGIGRRNKGGSVQHHFARELTKNVRRWFHGEIHPPEWSERLRKMNDIGRLESAGELGCQDPIKRVSVVVCQALIKEEESTKRVRELEERCRELLDERDELSKQLNERYVQTHNEKVELDGQSKCTTRGFLKGDGGSQSPRVVTCDREAGHVGAHRSDAGEVEYWSDGIEDDKGEPK